MALVLRRGGHFRDFLGAAAVAACSGFSCGRRPCFPCVVDLGAFFLTLPLPLPPWSPALTGPYPAHDRTPPAGARRIVVTSCPEQTPGPFVLLQ